MSIRPMVLITEQIVEAKMSIVEEATGRTYCIEGPFLQADIKNQNGRVYPKRLMEREVARYVAQNINETRAYGELGHPSSPTINLERTSHMIQSLIQDGSTWHGRAKIIDTPMGRIVKSLLDEGARLGVSSRGVGSLTPNGTAMIVQDDFYLATAADIVADPSAPAAFVRGIMEGKEWVWDNGLIREASIADIKKTVERSMSRKQKGVQLNEQVAAFKRFVKKLER